MEERLDPIGDPLSDAVLEALSRMLDQPLGLPPGAHEQRWDFEGAPCDVRLVFMRLGPGPGGRPDTTVTVTFGPLSRIVYQRVEGMPTITIDDAMLPHTIAAAVRGRRVGEVVDIPGIGHWTVTGAAHNRIDGCHILSIMPEGRPRSPS